MTTSAAPRHAWVDVIDLEDTVGFVLPPAFDAPTRAINVTRMRADDPATERLTFGALSTSGEQPLIVIGIDRHPTVDAMQELFNRFASGLPVRPIPPRGSHRAANQPGLLARLFRALGFGRRDGV